jgi:hypothetical protein
LHRLPSRCRINVDPAAIDGNGAFASGKFSQHREERWKKVFSRSQYDMISPAWAFGGIQIQSKRAPASWRLALSGRQPRIPDLAHAALAAR